MHSKRAKSYSIIKMTAFVLYLSTFPLWNDLEIVDLKPSFSGHFHIKIQINLKSFCLFDKFALSAELSFILKFSSITKLNCMLNKLSWNHRYLYWFCYGISAKTSSIEKLLKYQFYLILLFIFMHSLNFWICRFIAHF